MPRSSRKIEPLQIIRDRLKCNGPFLQSVQIPTNRNSLETNVRRFGLLTTLQERDGQVAEQIGIIRVVLDSAPRQVQGFRGPIGTQKWKGEVDGEVGRFF